MISSGSCGGAGGAVQTASVSAPEPTGLTYETYKDTNAAGICDDKTDASLHTFARVNSDGAIVSTCLDTSFGNCRDRMSHGMIHYTCAEVRQVVNWDRQGVACWDQISCSANNEGGKLVYVEGASGVQLDDCVQSTGNGNNIHGCVTPHSKASESYLTYNFETGIWGNDQGDKFSNGKLVE